MVLLGVNVDHVATIRQARGTTYPDPVASACEAISGGANQITIHLREDRRHIQDGDVIRMREKISVPLNLEMAAAEEIVAIACEVGPKTATLVPERREELTTEGGLDVASQISQLRPVVAKLKAAGIAVSLFIDPDKEQIDASGETGADTIELHTGSFCDASDEGARVRELERLMAAAAHSKGAGIRLCAGHGINYENAREIARALPQVVEYNIGHAIISRAISVGMEEAVREMKALLEVGST